MTASTPDFSLLDDALRTIQYRLEANGLGQLLVSRATLEEFLEQPLPPHCKARPCLRQGARVAVRGRRHIDQVRTVLARWPEDDLVEAAFPTIFCVLDGQADIRIADYSVHCRTGDMLFIPAGLPKWGGLRPPVAGSNKQAHCKILMFSPGLVNGQGLECGISYALGHHMEHGEAEENGWLKNLLVAQLFAGLSEELENEEKSEICFHFLSNLLLLLRRDLARGHFLTSWRTPVTAPITHKADSIRSATEYIRNNLQKPLSIDMAARHTGLSRTAFTQRFHKETGQSFKNYLTGQRLAHAQTLLGDTNLTINRISELVGLSPGQLRLLFQQHHHCTPGAFRLRKKNVRN
jgi:AraC-like DNA-binding protein